MQLARDVYKRNSAKTFCRFDRIRSDPMQSNIKLPSISTLLSGVPALTSERDLPMLTPVGPAPIGMMAPLQPRAYSIMVPYGWPAPQLRASNPATGPYPMSAGYHVASGSTMVGAHARVPVISPRGSVAVTPSVSPLSSRSNSTEHSKKAQEPADTAELKCVCRNNTQNGHHIPRPRNAFILFRQHLHQQLFAKESSESTELSFKTNSQVSHEIGQRWRALDDKDRQYWQELALKERELHKQRYPDYKYIPRRARAGKRQRKDGCEYCRKKRSHSS